jgi:hypothetical protein
MVCFERAPEGPPSFAPLSEIALQALTTTLLGGDVCASWLFGPSRALSPITIASPPKVRARGLRWEAGQSSSEFRLGITRMWSWLQTSFLQCAYWSCKLTSVRVCVQPAPSGGFCGYELHSSFNFVAVVDGRRGVAGLHDRGLIESWGTHTMGDDMSIVTYGLTDAGRKALKGGAQ